MKKRKNNQKGFALVLAILMLIVMSIMSITLVSLISGDFAENEIKDEYQQALYTAETAIYRARSELRRANLPTNNTATPVFANYPAWCTPELFKSLKNRNEIFHVISSNSINSANSGIRLLTEELTTISVDERNKYQDYEFFWFITYPPNATGNTSLEVPKVGFSSGNSGTSVSETASYNKTSKSGRYYSIFVCARKRPSFGSSSSVAALDVLVSAVR